MSSKNNILYLSETTKNMIIEAAALSGIAQSIIKEVFEYLLVDYSFKIADAIAAGEPAKLDIPYVGTLTVKYAGDEVLETGELSTLVDSSIELAPSFRKLIGDIYDEGYTELVPVLMKKFEQAIMVASSDE